MPGSPTKDRRRNLCGGFLKGLYRSPAKRLVNLLLGDEVQLISLYESERLGEGYQSHILMQRMAEWRKDDTGGDLGIVKLRSDVIDAIRFKSKEIGVPEDVVTAMVMVESSGSRWATRYEPGWKYFLFPRDYASRIGITEETEKIQQATSWGCLQIMGSVARECGWQGPLVMLTDLDLGLEYGCRKLKALMHKYEFESDYIAAYNAGSPRKTKGGMYVNQTHVDRVFSALRELRKIV